MRNLIYLLVAVGVILLGILIMALRAREPKGFDSGIKAHQRHMEALSTESRRDSTGIDRIQPVRRVDPRHARPIPPPIPPTPPIPGIRVRRADPWPAISPSTSAPPTPSSTPRAGASC
jgi:hypothetical protein